MDGMNGWGQLGAALAGGNAGEMSPGYQRGAASAARVANWLAEARKAETEGRLLLDKERARQEFEGSLIASGEAPEAAKMLSNAFAAGYNPEQLSGYQLDRQKVGLGSEAAAAARGGDVDLLNNILTAMSGKPRERTNIAGGVAYDPYAVPGQGGVATPTGQAGIAADMALAAQRSAGADQYDARAALYGRTDPNRPRSAQAELIRIGEDMRKDGASPEAIQQVLASVRTGKEVKVADPVKPSTAAATTKAPRKPASRAWTAPQVRQAINDAREAVRRGALTKEQAAQRLRDAGLNNAAEVL